MVSDEARELVSFSIFSLALFMYYIRPWILCKAYLATVRSGVIQASTRCYYIVPLKYESSTEAYKYTGTERHCIAEGLYNLEH